MSTVTTIEVAQGASSLAICFLQNNASGERGHNDPSLRTKTSSNDLFNNNLRPFAEAKSGRPHGVVVQAVDGQ